jgi:hypothetical protein
MKTLLAAGALLAVFASPAIAQDASNSARPNGPVARQAPYQGGGTGNGSYQSGNTDAGPGGAVIRNGQEIGRDPDPFIRHSLGVEWQQDAKDW